MQNKNTKNVASKVSIIVPVYNVKKYLQKCIESILVQTYTEFELLLIDDGSKDNSDVICDVYAERDKRVKVFHKKNGGGKFCKKFRNLTSYRNVDYIY